MAANDGMLADRRGFPGRRFKCRKRRDRRILAMSVRARIRDSKACGIRPVASGPAINRSFIRARMLHLR